ncbi:DNA alkylation repair protein [Dyadobacter chenwenxiniae]|uniref:DNA alkylation repair protein n=1 Tax=Dyadobacter chenwenxiniae TaxID=2906456 RepID=A0A9X1PPD1_9BACT|nr:DNA alkylation repair protein [Dyadobacter chenwenxiniae]MCF0065062.1 DNA alkylation repair protein [Dyadobacter chenwenxiniae]UON83177.1 DNA alkylation repair protein [Dyadobacter chenwenxiniae]
MMNQVKDIMNQLAELGSEQTLKTFRNHGGVEPMYGVKIGDMKPILKKHKNNHQLALELYKTGNSDVMYLAGLMSNPSLLTPEVLDEWVERAPWHMISEYTVAWNAAESPYGFEMARKWIESDKELIAGAGWSALGCLMALTPDERIDKEEVDQLLDRVENQIPDAPNRVRYVMNGFIIAVGSYYKPSAEKALEIANRVGKVSVNVGNTACKVPYAPDYIRKVWDTGRLGAKRKEVRC